MVKKAILLLATLAVCTSASAQGVEFFFSTLPNKYLSQLDQPKRQVLLNNARGKKDSTITNNYAGKSRLLVFDEENEYLRVQLSAQGNLSAKKFALPDGDPLFALCTWTCSPACDGDLAFFKGKNLTPTVSKNYAPNIPLTDFFISDSLNTNNITSENIKECFDMLLLRYEAQQYSDTILVIFDNETYLGEEAFEKWKRRMKGDRLPLVWKGNEFVIGEAFFEKK